MLQHTQNMGRIPAHNRMSGNGFCYNRAGGDYGVIPNGHAGINDRAAADSNVIANGDGFSIFQADFIALIWIKRVRGSVDAYA